MVFDAIQFCIKNSFSLPISRIYRVSFSKRSYIETIYYASNLYPQSILRTATPMIAKLIVVQEKV